MWVKHFDEWIMLCCTWKVCSVHVQKWIQTMAHGHGPTWGAMSSRIMNKTEHTKWCIVKIFEQQMKKIDTRNSFRAHISNCVELVCLAVDQFEYYIYVYKYTIERSNNDLQNSSLYERWNSHAFYCFDCGIVLVVGRVLLISNLGYVQHTSLLTASTIIITWYYGTKERKTTSIHKNTALMVYCCSVWYLASFSAT